MVTTGAADAMFSLKKTNEREAIMLFPEEPLILQDFVFFSLKNHKYAFTGNLSDISQARIGVVQATSYGKVFDTAVRDHVLGNIDITQSFELNFKKLKSGRLDFVINSKDVGIEYIRRMKAENEVIINGPPVERIESFLAFTKAKEYSDLAKAFDATMRQMKQDGTIRRIRLESQMKLKKQ